MEGTTTQHIRRKIITVCSWSYKYQIQRINIVYYYSFITLLLKHRVGITVAHPSLTSSLVILCSRKWAQDAGARPRDSVQHVLTNLTLAKRTGSIDLKPLVHTFLVHKMRTRQLPQLIIICIFCQTNAADLYKIPQCHCISMYWKKKTLQKRNL